mgnify:CR=1 FL=1
MRTDASDRVFEQAAELFSLLSTPARLRIVCELRKGEKSVSELLDHIGISQPNMSQHLGTLHRTGIVGRRRVGTKVYYRIDSERALLLCDAVCDTQAGRSGAAR